MLQNDVVTVILITIILLSFYGTNRMITMINSRRKKLSSKLFLRTWTNSFFNFKIRLVPAFSTISLFSVLYISQWRSNAYKLKFYKNNYGKFFLFDISIFKHLKQFYYKSTFPIIFRINIVSVISFVLYVIR